MKNNTIAIITARGGSKRIPGKNIKIFCGKPIISYSIEAALESKLFSEVMVSTDSMEIAEIAKQYGAVVPFMRSEKTADDYATTADVIMEVLRRYEKKGKIFKYACCIYPTAPFVTADKLRQAMEIMEKEKPVAVMPMTAFSYPPQRCFIINDEGNAEYKYEEYINARSQDLETQYHDAGQFYVYNIEKYMKLNGRVRTEIKPMIVSELEVQDIDNEEDWKMAELKYSFMKGKFAE
ncbi:MAG: pseudaminic acid cytidylyltransferase [Acetivibrio ethanolgignens]